MSRTRRGPSRRAASGIRPRPSSQSPVLAIALVVGVLAVLVLLIVLASGTSGSSRVRKPRKKVVKVEEPPKEPFEFKIERLGKKPATGATTAGVPLSRVRDQVQDAIDAHDYQAALRLLKSAQDSAERNRWHSEIARTCEQEAGRYFSAALRASRANDKTLRASKLRVAEFLIPGDPRVRAAARRWGVDLEPNRGR